MAGYVLAQLKVTDPQRFAEYGAQVPATIEKFGGRYLVRGGDMAARRGTDWPESVSHINLGWSRTGSRR